MALRMEFKEDITDVFLRGDQGSKLGQLHLLREIFCTEGREALW